ncbi:Zn-dependent peptidase ImmA (M78 family) [Paenibacillus baekrokdamisoli]|nr:Zn-dependent peptidase ImmA (M78 family) [Paenibacillus baekrokdamisoli]
MIAEQRNIVVLFEPLGYTMGYFNTYKRIPIIHINTELEDSDQLFTCAHELGHALRHREVNTPFRRHTLQSIDRIEREANEFAVELLVPDELLFNGMTIYEAANVCGVPAEVAHLKRPQKQSFWKDEQSYFNL